MISKLPTLPIMSFNNSPAKKYMKNNASMSAETSSRISYYRSQVVPVREKGIVINIRDQETFVTFQILDLQTSCLKLNYASQLDEQSSLEGNLFLHLLLQFKTDDISFFN